MEGKPHANIVICTPGSSMLGSYVQSLLRLVAYLAQEKITFAFANGVSSHVGDAREVTLSGTRENSFTEQRPLEGGLTYDKLMWIDSDIAFEPEDVVKLYKSDKDIISGGYLMANGTVPIHKETLASPITYEEVLEMKEPVKISGAGFGFICIKQGVFESLPRPWFQSVKVTAQVDGKGYDFNMMGEDLSFCESASQAGFEIWFDPSVRVTHHKTVKLTWEGIRP